MFTFINSNGEYITVNSIREFCEKYDVPRTNAYRLASGNQGHAGGWFSTHPKAKKKVQRCLTKLINIYTGEVKILGESIHHFARSHNLCVMELSRVINQKHLIYKGWTLKKAYDNIAEMRAYNNF